MKAFPSFIDLDFYKTFLFTIRLLFMSNNCNTTQFLIFQCLYVIFVLALYFSPLHWVTLYILFQGSFWSFYVVCIVLKFLGA